MFYTWKSEFMNFCGQKSLVRLLDSQAFFTGYLFLLIDTTVLIGSIDMYPKILKYRQGHFKICLIFCCHSTNRLQLALSAQVLVLLKVVFCSYFTVALCPCNASGMDLLYSSINRIMFIEVGFIFRDFDYFQTCKNRDKKYGKDN